MNSKIFPYIDKAVRYILLGAFVGGTYVYGSTKSNAAPRHSVQVQSPSRRLNRLTTNDQRPTTIPNWTARGAWNDWIHLDFPEGFSFPYGYNRLTTITLMSYGQIRRTLHESQATSHEGPTSIYQLPSPLALEPSVSEVAYGVTESNTFRIVWKDALVNRDPTNRVNAALELHPDGSIQTEYAGVVGRRDPTPPPGFTGHGQGLAWATNAFPDHAAAILAKGYETWLMEDCVGINVENGIYKAAITIAALPDDGAPCYLVCGPYKVIVPTPGTYSFPLEVFTEYTARTYPDAVPLSVSYDEGYRPEEFGDAETTVNRSPRRSVGSLAGVTANLLPVQMIPELHIEPNRLPVRSDGTGTASIFANIATDLRLAVTAVGDFAEATFTGRTVNFRNVFIPQQMRILYRQFGFGDLTGEIEFYEPGEFPPERPPTNCCDLASDCCCTNWYIQCGTTNGCDCLACQTNRTHMVTSP